MNALILAKVILFTVCYTEMHFAILLCVDPTTNSEVGMSRIIAPFVACGDLSGFDSDMTYPVQVYSILALISSENSCN